MFVRVFVWFSFFFPGKVVVVCCCMVCVVLVLCVRACFLIGSSFLRCCMLRLILLLFDACVSYFSSFL